MDVIADLSVCRPEGRTLIQRNLIQPKLDRGYLAFDKCTLLSSQGSDAPAGRPLGFPYRATSLSYPSRFACQVDPPAIFRSRWDGRRRRSTRGNLHPSPEDAKTLGVLLRMGFVLLLEGAGLSALRSSLWGEQQEHYVGSTHAANHARIPGVSRVIPRNTALSAVCGRCIARLPVPGSGSRPPPSEAQTPAGLRHPAAQDRAPARSGPATSARTLKPWTS